MRKTIAVAAATGALLVGGAGVADAETYAVGPAQTTTLAADEYGNNNDNTGLWGLTGLLGLLGLVGLRKQHDSRDSRAGVSAGVNRGHTAPTPQHGTSRTAGGATSSGMPAGPASGTSMGTSGSSAAYPTTPHSHPGNTPPNS